MRRGRSVVTSVLRNGRVPVAEVGAPELTSLAARIQCKYLFGSVQVCIATRFREVKELGRLQSPTMSTCSDDVVTRWCIVDFCQIMIS